MRTPLLVAALLVSAPFLAACTENAKESGGDAGDSRTVSVTSTDDGCDVSSTSVPAGTLTFDVTNDGSKVTEFYLLGEDGLRIVAEVENVGPQLSRQLVVNAPAGTYTTACKPGMKGDGIRADFTVTKSGDQPVVSTDDQQLVEHRAGQLLGLRPGPVRPAGEQDAGVRRRLQGRQRRRRPHALPRGPHPLGADRDRRRVLRRPRPQDRRPRGRPRARPEVDRLAPDREGPLARAGRGLHAAHPEAARLLRR